MSDIFAFDETPTWTVGSNGLKESAETAGTIAVFYTELVQNPGKTEKEGRPIFDEQLMLRLYTPGDSLSVASHPGTPDMIEKYRAAYDKYMAGKTDDHFSGTPIGELNFLTAIQKAELKAVKIYSVEALAAVADSNVTRIPGGRSVRDQAKAWLEHSKDTGASTRLAAENAALKDELARVKSNMDEMAKQIEELRAGSPATPPAPAPDVMAMMAEMQRQMAEMRAATLGPAYPGAGEEPQPEKRPPGRPRKDAA